MVGCGTRASNNHINWSVFGGKRNINIEKNVDEGGQKLHRCCRKYFGVLIVQLFFKDRHWGPGNLFQYFTTRTENAPLCAIICGCVLLARLGVGTYVELRVVFTEWPMQLSAREQYSSLWSLLALNLCRINWLTLHYDAMEEKDPLPPSYNSPPT